MYVAKTKALISFAVTAKLICVFVFAYAKRRFSHDAAHIFFISMKLPPFLVSLGNMFDRPLLVLGIRFGFLHETINILASFKIC